MKAPTLLAIAAMITVACFVLASVIPGPLGDRFRLIGGCMVLGFGGLALLAVKGIDYAKKKRQWEAERESQLQTQSECAPLPGTINPASTGFPTDGITSGERFRRSNEQAQSGDYTDVNAPADVVQVHNVDAPAKPMPDIQLEMTI